ncbi:MAG: response regulator [Candidatus Methanoperedenaceae archaeon]|nr:MAG: response regulator [Candidatus Methanoperedenaceae archaeon]
MDNQFPRAKILAVDDEPVNVELISGYLEKDYEIIPAYSGKEALEKVRLTNPDIVLLDIMMPEVKGYEVCEQIKFHDITRFTPIVIITALTEIEHKIKAIEAGADDFLTKPINRIELITRIKSLLKTKYYHDQLVRSKEQIEAQNEFKTIMTDILPLILQSIPPGKMTEVIGQMSKRVEDVIWDKYIKDIPKEIAETAALTCNVLNKLGGGFSVKEISQKGYVLVNDKCPWGEDGRVNPALCMMTKAIFARIGVHIYKDINVNLKKTIAGKDGCCLIELILR